MKEDSHIWTEEKFGGFIDWCWDQYCYQQFAYLLFSLIPLAATFVEGLYMRDPSSDDATPNDYSNAQICAIITCISVFCMNIYEFIQMFSSGRNYFLSEVNYIDVVAQSLYQINSLYIWFKEKNSMTSQV